MIRAAVTGAGLAAALRRYRSLCMRCCGPQVVMLTGYVITDARCEGCGRTADLAMTRTKEEA